ncbi:Dual specificity protein phosphatase 22 [Fasciolopsis buskii]|uniref:Dual specificity protein phosphatase 22 n=1 Tax=Fasciolopsis buskii TaxID=27845 RepID=A0A8E0VL06_9TREM|nr:Dual specificity protein phosphatase 22 [Fasciolopsis buski]
MGGSMTKVLSGLYVGALENTKNEEELMANGISHILVVQNEKYEIEKSPGRHYLQVVVNEQDDHAIARCLVEANDFIHAARAHGDNALVCSDSGMSASVAIVAAYLMSVYHLDSRSALGVVQGLRHAANPVASLQGQLERLESTSAEGVDTLSGISQSPARHVMGLPPVQQPISAAVEHARLMNKFGQWPRLDVSVLSPSLSS